MTTTPDPADVETPAPTIVAEWMEHLGHNADEIMYVLVDPLDHRAHGCELTPEGWLCLDENGRSHHPIHDEADEVAALVMFVLEHPALAGRLLPAGGERREEWRVVTGRQGLPYSGALATRAKAEHVAATAWHDARIETRTVTEWLGDTDDTVLTGPWREVTDGE